MTYLATVAHQKAINESQVNEPTAHRANRALCSATFAENTLHTYNSVVNVRGCVDMLSAWCR